MKQSIIEFKNFSFQYDAQAQPTLHDINLTIYEGERILIVGPSGSGKSTIGQLLNGIIPNTHQGKIKGEFLIRGQEAFYQNIYDKSLLVSTVLQDTDGQFIGLTVAEDMAFALENDMIDPSTMRVAVTKWSERLNLNELLHQRPQDLSGGQKQRVSLAGVLIDESPILLFDEPLANLDPKSGQETINLIDNLQEKTGATTIIIEHRLEDVLSMRLDRIILINDGRVVFDGRPTDLLVSGLLEQNGIREPLYLSVLRELGYDSSNQKSLDDLDSLDLSSLNYSSINAPMVKEEEISSSLLEVVDLSLQYGTNKILNNVYLNFYRGERLAIVGQNGAGKSSLAKALCQFTSADGQILWEGEDISQETIKERAERIGYVLQNPNQMISQTMIYDEVALGLRLRGIDEDKIERKVHEVLDICGLYPMRNWPISALSFGQKKRVTIASILVLGAKIILLDEPTAGQDKKHYTELMRFLNDLAVAGHTIVMITHDMQLMLEYSDRCLVLHNGQVIANKSPIEVLSDADLVAKAHLSETSIFRLARKIGEDEIALSQFYKERSLCRDK